MRSPDRSILFFVLLAAACLTGCRKTATIYGTWEETSVREVYQVNGQTTSDTTWYSGGGTLFTFTVHNAYYASNSEGTYTLTGSRLLLTDTTSAPYTTAAFQVLTLKDLLLILRYSDTISTSPLTTVQYTYTLSPH